MNEKTKLIIQNRIETLTGYINKNLEWIEEGNQNIKELREHNNGFEEEIKQLLMDLNEGSVIK